ncbi:MAG TPA: ATP-dependent sacrificial sulfur transferase LarE [Acidobacteriota bacterium]|nr:ATP-dependent sacrificial sulfur transferase LarE [Acidobacteriota bacterium]
MVQQEVQCKEDRLVGQLQSYSSAIVAFSGGVDSSYLAFMAHRVLGEQARAVTALSPAVSETQRKMAREFARLHGLRHQFIETGEMDVDGYTSNPANRCYYCKTELYGRLDKLREEQGIEVLLDGANLDDASDYRPGRQAAREKSVSSPLLECSMSKDEIRRLSRKWGLKTWDKPAMPCLSSRFPYGVTITEEKLSQVERAEDFLRGLGLRNFRVRHHESLARLEVDGQELPMLLDPELMQRVHERLREIGYLYVTLDLKPFRSGSLNDALNHGAR